MCVISSSLNEFSLIMSAANINLLTFSLNHYLSLSTAIFSPSWVFTISFNTQLEGECGVEWSGEDIVEVLSILEHRQWWNKALPSHHFLLGCYA